MDFDRLDLCFCFGRRYSLCDEFYGLDGTSIIESVVLRSVWGLLLRLSICGTDYQ